jgi:hypothetical protein
MRGHEGVKRNPPTILVLKSIEKQEIQSPEENRVYSTLYQKAQLVTKTIQT